MWPPPYPLPWRDDRHCPKRTGKLLKYYEGRKMRNRLAPTRSLWWWCAETKQVGWAWRCRVQSHWVSKELLKARWGSRKQRWFGGSWVSVLLLESGKPVIFSQGWRSQALWCCVCMPSCLTRFYNNNGKFITSCFLEPMFSFARVSLPISWAVYADIDLHS